MSSLVSDIESNLSIKLTKYVFNSFETNFELNMGFKDVQCKILASYVKFFKVLLNSKSPELALVANFMGLDVSSTTGGNLYRLRQDTGLNPWLASPTIGKMALQQNDVLVLEEDGWRLKHPFE